MASSFDFDRLARGFAARQSRRNALKLAGGLGIGAAMLPHLPALAQDATPVASPAPDSAFAAMAPVSVRRRKKPTPMRCWR